MLLHHSCALIINPHRVSFTENYSFEFIMIQLGSTALSVASRMGMETTVIELHEKE